MKELDSGKIHLNLEEVKPLAEQALMRTGCNQENAGAVAECIYQAEQHGTHSHGLFRMPGYLASLASGKVNGRASPKLATPKPSLLAVDGDGGYAPLAHRTLAKPLAELAKSQGVAMAALTNTFHFAALWQEVEMLANEGVVALACTAFKPALPPAGGKDPLYGTNPVAFSWPRKGGEPCTFDQASSVMARGEVMIAAREGHALPDGAGIDSDGNPTNDPEKVLKGALLPFGGYKGASIAMMVELLAASLIGEQLSFEAAAQDNNDGGPPRGGEFILALDPAHGLASSEGLFAKMLEQEGARLPGDGRRAKRDGIAKNGIQIPAELYSKITG
ncbi:MAG: Ldh family oxidoreductase [Rhizobiaceae bacterium]|nr:Ldh family oxidoreductase [Rhizobiaceae bacterium]